MKNKGFTLIELLAVIVILALIALVTIPMINNVIEKAKKGALEDSVYGLKSAAELYYSTTGTSETIEFNCDESGCINGDKKLPFKGSVEDGKVKLFSDGKVSICLTEDGYGSSILADEKKVTTKMGGCDEETYKVSEVIAIEKYKEVNEKYNDIKETLYNKTLISSVSLEHNNMLSEISNIDLNEGEAANKKGLANSLQYSGLGITEDMSWEEIYEKLSNTYPAVKSLSLITDGVVSALYSANISMSYGGGKEIHVTPGSSGSCLFNYWNDGGPGNNFDYVGPVKIAGHKSITIDIAATFSGDQVSFSRFFGLKTSSSDTAGFVKSIGISTSKSLNRTTYTLDISEVPEGTYYIGVQEYNAQTATARQYRDVRIYNLTVNGNS